MFAIIATGGKQYRVSVGEALDVEKLEKAVGEKISFECLMFSDDKKTVTGNPYVKGVKCEAEIVAHGKGDKLVVFKYKPKKNVRKKQGHRQPFTRIKITAIQ